jgi:hypothetical protein
MVYGEHTPLRLAVICMCDGRLFGRASLSGELPNSVPGTNRAERRFF